MNNLTYSPLFKIQFRHPLRYLALLSVVAAGGCVHSPPRAEEFGPQVIHRGAEILFAIAAAPAGQITTGTYSYTGGVNCNNSIDAGGDAVANAANLAISNGEKVACSVQAYKLAISGATQYWSLTSQLPNPAQCRYVFVYNDPANGGYTADPDVATHSCP